MLFGGCVVSSSDTSRIERGLDALRTTTRYFTYAGCPSLPTLGQVEELVTACFWSSLGKYEGAERRFRVSVWPRTRKIRGVALVEPRPLTSQTLAEIGPALSDARSTLLLDMESGTSEVWGVSNVRFYDGLVVDVLAPGCVRVSVLGAPLFVTRQETISFLEFAWKDVAAWLALSVLPDEQYGWSPGVLASTLIQETRRLARGGTFLFVPDSSNWDSLASVLQGGYRLAEPENGIETSLETLRRAYDAIRSDRSAADLVDFGARLSVSTSSVVGQLIASLAARSVMDGAVVLDRRMSLWGFGARITAESSDLDVELVSPTAPERNSVRLSRLGGTRHQSAYRLVNALPGASALVISHDGPVTVFLRRSPNTTVECVRDVELLL